MDKKLGEMYIEIQVPLPCGCVLKHKAIDKQVNVGHAKYETHALQIAKNLLGILLFWAANRYGRHHCSLVAADNPAGYGRPVRNQDLYADLMEHMRQAGAGDEEHY